VLLLNKDKQIVKIIYGCSVIATAKKPSTLTEDEKDIIVTVKCDVCKCDVCESELWWRSE